MDLLLRVVVDDNRASLQNNSQMEKGGVSLGPVVLPGVEETLSIPQ